MRALIVLSMILSVGCTAPNLVLRDTDNFGLTAVKVTTRAILVVPTLGMSEVMIMEVGSPPRPARGNTTETVTCTTTSTEYRTTIQCR